MSRKLKLVVSFILAIVHNIIFWDQYLGVNSLVFSVSIIVCMYFLYPTSFKLKLVKIMAASLLLVSIAVVVNGSFIARFATIVCSVLFTVAVHTPQLKSIFYLVLASFEKLFRVPSSLSVEEVSTSDKIKKGPKLTSILRIWLLPIVAFFVFLFIYKAANPMFDRYVTYIFEQIGLFFTNVFQHFSIGRIFFFNFGLLIAFYIIFRPGVSLTSKYELGLGDFLIRKRKPRVKIKGEPRFLLTDLKTELKIATSLMILINLLIFVVNAIDINWLWFNFNIADAGSLSQLVHEGTYLLILSIVLSMFIIGYFYRGNINFLNNKTLKILSFVWISQNIIMVVSVGIRNFHYISQHGLAYKRIGVIIFLILVIVGLLSQASKINNTNSSFFLLRINSWATFYLLLIVACINWDIVIANHNLSHASPKQTDLKFLLSLSNKTLPLLRTKAELFKSESMENWRNGEINILEQKAQDFIIDYKNRSFWSWNYADYCAFNQLTRNP